MQDEMSSDRVYDDVGRCRAVHTNEILPCGAETRGSSFGFRKCHFHTWDNVAR